MKVLIISTDGKILEEGSAVRSRMLDYGTICEELHVIITKLESRNIKHEAKIQIAKNVFIYPSIASNKIISLLKAYRIGLRILTENLKLKAKNWLVTAQDPFETGFLAWRIARKIRAKLELQVHTDFLSPYFVKSNFLNRIRLLMARFLLPKADGIRVVSTRILDSLQTTNYKLQTTPIVLPIYVDAKKIMETPPSFDLHEKYPQFKFIIFTAARLEKEKNISFALKAMSNVVRQYPNVGFVISGAGSEEKDLKLQAKNLKLETNIVFEGEVKDVISRYKTADLYLSTSDYEGYGLSLVEAALSGCPIVTTDVGVVGEILKDGVSALVCSPGDVGCLGANIIRFVADSELKKQFKRIATAEIIKTLTTVDQHLDILRGLWSR